MRSSLTLLMVFTLGCAGTFDLLSGDRFTRRADERAPTGETIERREYRTSDIGEGLQCSVAERAIERRRTVEMTYRRRGGLEPELYGGLIAGDVVMGGLTGGTMLALCLNDHLSCWHLLWASPFALDMLYGAVRLAMAKPAVLIAKESSADWVGIGEVPIAEQPTQCEDVRTVHLGVTEASSDERLVRADGEGTPALKEGAVQVPLGSERVLEFSIAVLEAWAEHPDFGLWVVDEQGAARPVAGIDRCKAIVHHRNAIPLMERSAALQGACPPEPPADAR